MIKLITVVLLLVVFITIPLFSGDSLPEYEPYEDDEFPQWARDLRRSEIIFFGTIPFTFFLSSISYDFYRFAYNDYNEAFAPAILGNKTPPIRTNDEKLQIILVSVSLSGVLALADYLLGLPWNE